MKTTFYLLLVLFTGLMACNQENYMQKEGFCTALPTNDTVVFGYASPVPVFAGCEKNLQATISRIDDSRCPQGVQCVWAGKAAVTLEMNNGFSINLEKDKLVDTVYAGKHYSFTLVDVTPYPSTQQTGPNDKKVRISIMRR